MRIDLPPLPYAESALSPLISAETIQCHYGKHQRAYVDKVNELIEGTPFARKPLEEIVRGADGEIFDNAAQVWNHTFYWHSMTPEGGGKPTGPIATAVEAFGGYDKLRRELTEAAVTLFGSGWAWLVSEGGKLGVRATGDAQTPLTTRATPLIAIDVWEHAYYLDYRNQRPKYVEAFFDRLLSWDFANANLSRNQPKAAARATPAGSGMRR